MRIEFLKNCSQLISTLAQWLYDEWHPYDSTLTKEKLIHSFNKRTNTNSIPITFVVLKNNLPIGVISLKDQTDPEFLDFPKNSVWMGSLHVIPEERNRGLGQTLLKFAQTVTQQLGHDTLYFYTSNQANVQWYLKRGAQVIEKDRVFHKHRITIMKILL
jgi:ribosomal protein S18 acetylase RimI-like enzyme